MSKPVAPSPPTTEPLTDDEKEHMLNHPNLKEAARSVDRAIKQPFTEEQYKLAVETQLFEAGKINNYPACRSFKPLEAPEWITAQIRNIVLLKK